LNAGKNFYKATPCPICGGFNSGRKTSGTLCKGFRHQNKEEVFCQRKQSNTITNIKGLVLYKHKIIGSEPRGTGNTRLVPEAEVGLPDPTQVVYGDYKGTCVVEESRRYEGLRVFGKEQVPEVKTWYVVMREGEEVTRDLNLDRAKLFVR
jgi:hypothetical protein